MNLINYLLSAGLILAAFFSLYRLVSLRSETSHKLNRTLLLCMLALSFVLSLCRFTIHRPIQEPVNTTKNLLPIQQHVNGKTVIPVLEETPENEDPLPATIIEQGISTHRSISWYLLVLTIWAAGAVAHLARTLYSVLQIQSIIRINGISWLQLNSPAGRICAIGMHANNLNNILEVMTEGAQ